MSGHHQDWKEITIGKRPSSTGSGSAKAAKDPKAVAAVRARRKTISNDGWETRHDATRRVVTIGDSVASLCRCVAVDAGWERTDDDDRSMGDD